MANNALRRVTTVPAHPDDVIAKVVTHHGPGRASPFQHPQFRQAASSSCIPLVSHDSHLQDRQAWSARLLLIHIDTCENQYGTVPKKPFRTLSRGQFHQYYARNSYIRFNLGVELRYLWQSYSMAQQSYVTDL
ncbi:hypothetical protein E2C01_020564 [Portunus trituberculatus]|uniref:Uncharacterized protein n=1 Tax=Portunus trituberculatus TaxID=210409 RepID=A0A5B7E3R1_PORTR|nr:hypothetical protein [Portunus trituberculatus]